MVRKIFPRQLYRGTIGRTDAVGQAILLVGSQRQSKTAAAEHAARGVSRLGEGGDEGEFGQFSIDRP